MIQWKTCPRCIKPCVLRPVGSLYDQDGTKYGFYFACPVCSYYSLDVFVSKAEVEEYQKHQTLEA